MHALVQTLRGFQDSLWRFFQRPRAVIHALDRASRDMDTRVIYFWQAPERARLRLAMRWSLTEQVANCRLYPPADDLRSRPRWVGNHDTRFKPVTRPSLSLLHQGNAC